MKPNPRDRAPTRRDCERALAEVARDEGLSETDILFSPARRHTHARHRVWSRVIADTGCSQNGLAKVWGVDNATVISGLRRVAGETV